MPYTFRASQEAHCISDAKRKLKERYRGVHNITKVRVVSITYSLEATYEDYTRTGKYKVKS